MARKAVRGFVVRTTSYTKRTQRKFVERSFNWSPSRPSSPGWSL